MKKIASLLLAAVLLASMLTVFAVPASAAESYPIKINPNEDVTYSDMTIDMSGKKVSRLFTISGTMNKDITRYLEFQNVTFKNIAATEDCGGCVYVDVDEENKTGSCNLAFENCTFINCSAGKYGGAVYINDTPGGKIYFENCTFENCDAKNGGGAIYCDDDGANIEISDTFFSGCDAVNGKGGAININNGIRAQFFNVIGYNCTAEYGGFLRTNDGDLQVTGSGSGWGGVSDSSEIITNGNGNTVISGCSAKEGGGVYLNAVKKFDGFCLTDNKSEGDGGGVYNNTGNDASSTIKNCLFYHNAAGDNGTNKYSGGGLYSIDDNGYLKDCRFIENTAYKNGCEFETNMAISGCTCISNKTGQSAVYDRDGSYSSGYSIKAPATTLNGSGAENDPYKISSDEDWYALCKSVRNGSTYAGKYLVLQNDIRVFDTVGAFNSDASKKKPFSGIFDGNGKTITLYSVNGASDKATFGCAKEATVKNLNVNGFIYGAYSLGGIYGNASGCTAENCTNDTKIKGTDHYIGGIAGWSGNGSKFINCINNATVRGNSNVGGIAGRSGENTRFLNCANNGSIIGNSSVGDIVGNSNGDNIALGSALSEGNLWIIIAVVIVALAGIATLVIVKKKKKPATAGGENTDEE